MYVASPSLPPAKRLRGAQFRFKAQAEGVGDERKSSDAGGDTRIRADRFAIPAPELLRPSVVGVGMGGVQEYYSLEEIVAAIQFTLLSPSTLLWGFVGVLSVHVCGEYLHVYYDMNFSIVASGLIFPKSFAISNAFGRREFALRTLARMKATSASILWTFRDWDLQASRLGVPNTTASMAVNSMSSPAASTAYLLLQELHLNIRAYVQADRCASEAEVVCTSTTTSACSVVCFHFSTRALLRAFRALLRALLALRETGSRTTVLRQTSARAPVV